MHCGQTFRQYDNPAGMNVILTAVADEDGHAGVDEAGLVCGEVPYCVDENGVPKL